MNTSRTPGTPPPRRTMTRAFRNQMLRQAALFFCALALVLFALLRTLNGKQFALAALILIPAATLTFNLLQRRAYTATQQGKR